MVKHIPVTNNSTGAQPVKVHKATATLLAKDPDHFRKLAKKRKNITGGGFKDPDVARKAANKRWAGHVKKSKGKSTSQKRA